VTDSLHFDLDAYTPTKIAARVELSAVAKSRQSISQTVALSILAGAFIGFGALFYTLVITGSSLGFGLTRLLGGVAFSLGLILVVVAGAELFTGNNLMVMAWADRRITTLQLLRNWCIVYIGNFVGALLTVALVLGAGILSMDDGAVADQTRQIAASKLELSITESFFRGVLCNVLVCLAIWLSFAGRSVTDKILAIIFPISAFVACGFEHSVANMYVIPVAMFGDLIVPDIQSFLVQLAAVTLGNVVGGGVLVALTYWTIYVRASQR
jgi:formate transporter